jgi:hemerythrin-like domain-containing protein
MDDHDDVKGRIAKYGPLQEVASHIMQRRAVRKSKRMERPTDNLRADHILASRGIGVLAAIADCVQVGDEFPAADCASVLRFLREWVIAVHMRKEDEILGPAVAMRGDEEAAAIVGELMRLREEISELAHALVLFWEPVDDLTDAERAGFAETVKALVARLNRRQFLEDNDLFPACDANVPPDDQLDWLEQFAQLEKERGSREFWATKIDQLATNWFK